jgi:hypothetical protein
MEFMRGNECFAALRVLLVGCVALALPWPSHAARADHPASELTGTWRGTSVCTDRVATPACKDESVVYDFTAGPTADSVHWKADKIVEGKRLPMGEFDLVYSRSDSCWTAELTTPRFHMVWRVTVNGQALKGSAILLPGKQVVRKIDARKD